MPFYSLLSPSLLILIQLPSPSALLLLTCSFPPLKPLLRLPLFRGCHLSKTASAKAKEAFAGWFPHLAGSLLVKY